MWCHWPSEAKILNSSEELQKHAYTTNAQNIVFHGSSRLSPGVAVDGADIVNLGLAFNRDQDRIVIAEKGTRMILKEYVNALSFARLAFQAVSEMIAKLQWTVLSCSWNPRYCQIPRHSINSNFGCLQRTARSCSI